MRSRRWWVLAAVGISSFMTALDTSVVNIILPVMTRHFASDIATMEWVITVYLLVINGFLLTFGRLGDLRGHKQLYLLGFFVFTASSALAGFALSPRWLIASRALQALGAAMLFANSPAILTRNFPPSQHGQALGMHGMIAYLGLTTGPSFGGWLADLFGWRSVFYVNVPVGLLAIGLVMRAVPPEAPSQSGQRFDFSGAVLFTAGLSILLLALNQGHSWGWTSTAVISLAGASILLLAAFVVLEARIPDPMLDLALFRSRFFSASVLSALLNYVCLNCALFLMPFYLIQGRALTASRAGLILTVQPLMMSIAAPLSGKFSDRVGTRLPATVGMAILAAGLLLLASLGPDTPLGSVAAVLAILGLGAGIFISPNSSALMGSAPRQRQGIAAGILATARNVGMVLGVGFAGAILTTALADSAGEGIFRAIRISLLAAFGFAVVGAFVSALRGK
jgi:EmrB/QacA subfamily drug resistance transporter